MNPSAGTTRDTASASSDRRSADAGGTESSAQRIYGWRSPQMLMRYAAARGVERAIGEHRRLGIADRL